MSSSPPSDFDRLVEEIREVSAQLDMANTSLERLYDEVDEYERSDDRRLLALRVLMESRLDLARQYCSLAIVKAQHGIVGFSWYKPKDEES